MGGQNTAKSYGNLEDAISYDNIMNILESKDIWCTSADRTPIR